MKNKVLTDKEKQFTVMPNEADPKYSLAKANQAVLKALSDVKKSRKVKTQKS